MIIIVCLLIMLSLVLFGLIQLCKKVIQTQEDLMLELADALDDFTYQNPYPERVKEQAMEVLNKYDDYMEGEF